MMQNTLDRLWELLVPALISMASSIMGKAGVAVLHLARDLVFPD